MAQKIESDKLLVKHIFSKWFRIPEYQRPYVWGEDQVIELLDDVMQARTSNPDSQYFLGSMVLSKNLKEEGTTKYEEYDLLDGQQRLTTLFLITAVVRDLTPKINESRLKICHETIYQMACPDDNSPERLRIVFDIRGKTKDFINEYVKEYGGTAKEDELKLKISNKDEDISIRNMAKAILNIREYFSKNSIDSSTYEIYIRSLIGDLARWQIQEISIKQILRSISNKLTTNISWQSIVKDTDIGSHNTISKYVGNLEDSFVLSTLYSIDISKKNASFKKEKKIYFQDPFIFHSLRAWVMGLTDYFNSSLLYLGNPEIKGKLVESVVGNHLVRLMYNIYPSDVFTLHEHVFYWRKKGGKIEVDFVLKSGKNDLFPVELKYQNQIQNSDYKGLYTFKKGILLSKNKFDVTGNYVTIPVSLFLLLI